MRSLALVRRRRAPFASAAVCIAALFSLMASGPTTSQAAVDPYNLDSSGNLGVNSTQSVGQSFICRIGGSLQGIEFAPQLDSALPSDQVFLDVYDPSGLRGTVSITAAAFPPGNGVPASLDLAINGPGYFNVSSLGVQLIEGRQYSFVLRKPTGGTIRAGASSNTYLDGTSIVNGSPSPTFDLAFKIVFGPAPRLLVGAANGAIVRAYNVSNGALARDFTKNAPFTSGPSSLVLGGPQQRLYVKTWGNGGRIDEFDGLRGTFVRTLVSTGVKDGGGRMTIGLDGRLYGPSATNGVARWNLSTGALVSEFVPAGTGGLGGVGGLTFGPDGNLYVGSINYLTNQHKVLRYNGTTGAFIGEFVPNGSGGLIGPDDITFGPGGHLYVTSRDTHNILRYDGASGAFLGVFAWDGAAGTPFGLVFGPDGFLYVSYCDVNSVQRFNGTTGAFMSDVVHGTNPCPTDLLFTDGTIVPQLGVTPRPPVASGVELLPLAPNPTSQDLSIRFRLTSAAEVSVRVHDVSGRTVRSLLERSTYASGEHAIAWDARDTDGARVRPGMYFVDLVTSERRSRRSVVVLDSR